MRCATVGLLALIVLHGCVSEPPPAPAAQGPDVLCDGVHDDAALAGDAELGVAMEELSTISCAERADTGYTSGTPFPITVVEVDGKPVERDTANAYYRMAEAAAAEGVEIRVVSGFRTMAEQEYFYHCYVTCSCNGCNLAARPGYSNHQSGHALDLNTRAAGVLTWLNANGARFGFSRTVPSEAWHWEWWGGGPGGGPCGHCPPRCDGTVMTSADCSVGDCAAFGATCASDDLGTRCVSVFCPARGTDRVCVDATQIGECRDGGISVGDCAAFGATCVDDDLGARCSSVFCPARGRDVICLDDTHVATCTDGAIESGDCAAFGAWCSEAGVSEARCVSVFCTAGPSDAVAEHDICMPDGQRAHCNADGFPVDAAPCPAGTTCLEGACVAPSTPGAPEPVPGEDPGGATDEPPPSDPTKPPTSATPTDPRGTPVDAGGEMLTGSCAAGGHGGPGHGLPLALAVSALLVWRRRRG